MFGEKNFQPAEETPLMDARWLQARAIVRQLEEPARNLLNHLRPKIDNLEYDSVLGDDTSGRIHARLLAEAIDEIYGERKKLSTVFVQGGTILKANNYEYNDYVRILGGTPVTQSTTQAEEVADYLSHMKPRLGSKTLVVTEEIGRGDSIEKLVSILRSKGVEADAVSFGTVNPRRAKDNLLVTKGGTEIVLGNMYEAPIVPEKYAGTQRRRRSGRGHALKRQPETENERKGIYFIRQATKELAHKLAMEYLAQERP